MGSWAPRGQDSQYLVKGQRQEHMRLEKKGRFWALSNREPSKGPRKLWNGMTAMLSSEDTRQPSLMGGAYFWCWQSGVGWGVRV